MGEKSPTPAFAVGGRGEKAREYSFHAGDAGCSGIFLQQANATGKVAAMSIALLYQMKRTRLLRKLGNECVYCGRKSRLEFHHTRPRTWVAAKTNRMQRLRLYERDAANGAVVIACRRCNLRQGTPTETGQTGQDYIEDIPL